jgi:predicted ATPase/DNA-binding winged helix-turn-helix (wHTH) protein
MTNSESVLPPHYRSGQHPDRQRPQSPPPFEAGNGFQIGHDLSADPGRINGCTGNAILFGSFRLLPKQRLLLETDKTVRIGSRALDMLIMLVENAGELVSKEELMARVWPKTFVEPSNLTVHIATLRRLLGDGRGGKRYLVNVPGRGYRFVAPVAYEQQQVVAAAQADAEDCSHNLPMALTRPLGREDALKVLTVQIPQRRLITLVGTGGVGKTTVALSVADRLTGTFEDGIHFIDLAPLSDASVVPSAVASVLGVAIRSGNPFFEIIDFLKNKRMLLVLDSCEHLIGAGGFLAAAMLRGAPGVHMLATSREPLHVEGEYVCRLPPLETPDHATNGLTAAVALSSPAVQLFVERAAASLGGFDLSDFEAATVAEICSKLDGIPLAIELAAARVPTFGIRGVAAHLNDRMQFLTTGGRSASARHSSLRATLDWSYDWLPQHETIVLRRLSIFAGGFGLEAASAIAADGARTSLDTADFLTSLVKKSLVSADVSGRTVRYRLLDTVRAYLLEKLNESGEFDEIARRHAEFFRDMCRRAEANHETLPASEWIADYSFLMDNVRTALDWAFSPGGDTSIGVPLTVASLPQWYRFSLLQECRVRVERALASVDGKGLSTRHEMELYAALGRSMLYTMTSPPQADAALTRALDISERLDDSEFQVRALWGIWVCRTYGGQFAKSLKLARRFSSLATKTGNSANLLLGDRLMGFSLHCSGDQAGARRYLEGVLAAAPHHAPTTRYGFDQAVLARTHLARISWLQGFPDQAMEFVQSNIDSAETNANKLLLCYALADSACPISILVGDLARAEHYATMLNDRSEELALDGWWSAWGRGLKGVVLIRRGEVSAGLQLLHTSMDELDNGGFGLRYTELLGAMADGLSINGPKTDGLVAVDHALARCAREEERWIVPELLRIKGELLLLQDRSSCAQAQEHFMRSLDCAREQQVLSWELRAATSLARLQRDSGGRETARDLLMSVYARFSEGFETADLKSAKSLLDELA